MNEHNWDRYVFIHWTAVTQNKIGVMVISIDNWDKSGYHR